MNCQYCQTKHRKFYCTDCIKEKLDTHEQEFSTCNLEKNAVVAEANEFIQKATLIQNLIAEKNKRLQHIEAMRQTQKTLLISCTAKSTRIQQLKNQIKDKQKLLEESLKRKAHFDNNRPDNQAIEKAWLRTHKITVGTRRILVKEITSLFELKPGLIEEPETPVIQQQEQPPFSKPFIPNEADLYICGVSLSSRLIDVSKVPKEELNAPIGLVIHMLGLIVRYLGIKLPFEIIRRGIRPYIRALNKQHVRKFPLFLEDDEKNFKKFVHGMAMLNYDIAYVCFTQGVQIPTCQTANTLQSLISISRAPRLGIKSHATYFDHIRDLECPLVYDQILRATTLRFRCSSSLEISQFLEPSGIQTSNNELHDDFFKVINSAISTNNGERVQESEDDNEFGLYVDSDEDDDEFYKDKKQEVPPDETWSLVEVAPFVVGGRAAHNGTENIFQMSAASFMPGVMNMMESLGNNSAQSYYRNDKRKNNN